MTAMIGLPLSFLIGLAVGWGRRYLFLAAAAWYAALAWQTAYIAHVGRSAFGGRSGLDTVHWWVYWAFQPVLLALAAGLLWAGSQVRAHARQFVVRRRTMEPVR